MAATRRRVKLGEGSFAYIFKDVKDDKVVAIKKYKMESLVDPKSFLMEINILCGLSHPNIIRSYDIVIDKYLPEITLEFGKSLSHIIKTEPPYNKLDFIFQIGSGLDIMLKNGYLHCDIKQDNVIIVNKVAKLADPGMAVKEDSRYKIYDGNLECQTSIYKAPEHYTRQKLTPSGEIWSYALLVIELLMWKNEYLLGLKLPKQNLVRRFLQYIKEGNLKRNGLRSVFAVEDNKHDVIFDEIVNMLEYDSSKRTRDLGGFLLHPHFTNNNLIYRQSKESLQPEIWLPIHIGIDDYIEGTRLIYNLIIKYNVNFKAFNLVLTLFNALIGNNTKEKYYYKIIGYFTIAKAYYDSGLNIWQITDEFNFRSTVSSESVSDIILETKGITLYQTPYDLASDYNSMYMALTILLDNTRNFIIDDTEYTFSNIEELCKLTDVLSQPFESGLTNAEDVIVRLNEYMHSK